MKIRLENYSELLLKSILLIAVLISLSCSKRDEKKLIPEKEFSVILTEIHLANGILFLPDIKNKFASKDSVITYMEIFERHGYSKEEMENTLKYYFLKKPKKLIKIYDQAIGKLTEAESILLNESDEESKNIANMWLAKKSFYLPDTSYTEKIPFSQVLYAPGIYKMEFTVTIDPFDQSVNPCLTAWTCHADSAATGNRSYQPSVRYYKDGLPHKYSLTIDGRKNSPLILQGFLYDYGNNPEETSTCVKIENISISFIQ